MEIKELQEFIAKESDHLQKNYLDGYDLEKRILHAAVKTNEEVGELCDVVLKKIGAQRSTKLGDFDQSQIEGEVADVYFTTGLLAHLLEIDLEKALKGKMTKIESRYDKDGREADV